MESYTFKIRFNDENLNNNNILLAIHCPLEVFYLSVKESALKNLSEEQMKNYYVTQCDFFDSGDYITTESVICNIFDLFNSKGFKEFCYTIYKDSEEYNDSYLSDFVSKLVYRYESGIDESSETISEEMEYDLQEV